LLGPVLAQFAPHPLQHSGIVQMGRMDFSHLLCRLTLQSTIRYTYASLCCL